AVPVAGVGTRVALAVDDIHPTTVGAECDIGRVVRRGNKTDRSESEWTTQGDHRDRVRSGVDRVKHFLRGVHGDRRGRGTRCVPWKIQKGGTAGVDLVDDLVAGSIDDRDLVLIVLRGIE